MFKFTPVVKQLLIINILVYIASMIFKSTGLALYYPGSPNFEPYQIVTHFFMHGSIAHIFFNMFALVMFGSALETLWGPKRFLFYYFFCAIGAATIHLGYNYFHFTQLEQAISAFQASPGFSSFNSFYHKANLNMLSPESRQWITDIGQALGDISNDQSLIAGAVKSMTQYLELEKGIPVVGASGAIYGLLIAFGILFPNAELMLIFFPVPIKAKYFIPILIIVELYLGMNRFSWDNIAHFAHLGGALFGLLLILYWRKFDRNYRIK